MKQPLPTAAGLAVFLLASGPATAKQVGFDGYFPYDPLCGTSCIRSFGSLMLSCTAMSDSGGGGDMHMMATTPDCYGSNEPYLTSVAWCINVKCASSDVSLSKLEALWQAQITTSPLVAAKWGYSESLINVNPKPPTRQVGDEDMGLNVTSLVNPTAYLMQHNVLSAVERESTIESYYSLAIFLTGLCLPLLLTWLAYLPFMSTLFSKLKPYLVYPGLIGTYSVRPLPYLLGNAPNVGQALFLAVFISLNVILSAIAFESRMPSAWYATAWREIIAYLLYRTGTFGYMMLPLCILFSTRNNPLLLWWTGFSHNTYLLLHRWVGRLFMLYAVLHSIFGLLAYRQYENTAWWRWGAVATVLSVVLALGSGLYVRRFQYEVFLVSHVLLTVFVIAGCWYHIIGWYESMGIEWPTTTWGYEDWLYAACAIWFADRLVRVLRVLKNGVRRARVVELGDGGGGGYVRVDIPGVRWGLEPGSHVYAYFPTLNRSRPWENHPFSVVPAQVLTPGSGGSSSAGSAHHQTTTTTGDAADAEKLKHGKVVSRTRGPTTPAGGGAGITLFIKKASGLTASLTIHENLLTLLDGPYTNRSSTRQILRCDRLLLIAGGIGITSILPWAHNHRNVKVAWSVKESARCLVDEVEGALSSVLGGGDGSGDKDVRVGSRLDVDGLIVEEESAGWGTVGVVVSGPGGLCDNVRAAVARAGRRGRTVFELDVDAYSW